MFQAYPLLIDITGMIKDFEALVSFCERTSHLKGMSKEAYTQASPSPLCILEKLHTTHAFETNDGILSFINGGTFPNSVISVDCLIVNNL